VNLSALVGVAAGNLSDLFSSDALLAQGGPAISLPIFDGGRRSGNLTVARARDDIAVATYERTVQTAFREVADALAQRRYLAEQVTAQGRALAAQRALADLARARYLNGVAQYIEVLDAERNLFAAEQAMIQLHSAELQNRVALYIALGGGQSAEGGVSSAAASPASGAGVSK
jgi:multidrug efflux system outer membrane protein